MDITVILCTYNRYKSLGRALESVAASSLPDSVTWEILVVDNNSSDRTREVVMAYCELYPNRFRYLFEPTPGKSHALNSGIRGARGEKLAFMDDDVTVDPVWLQRLSAVLDDNQWAGVGGRIVPPLGFVAPRWLSLHGPYGLGGVLALFDRGGSACELDSECAPYGTNMCFRKVMFERYGMFRTDLGPNPQNAIRGEDIEFGRRLISAGERLGYEPSAVVYHPVTEERLKKAYFLAFWFNLGRSSIRERAIRPRLWLIPHDYLTILKTVTLLAPVRIGRWLFSMAPEKRFYAKCWVWKTAGEVVELSSQPSAS
jgi:glycosyltransferase involved in cell wall biosynthesis